MRVLRTGGTAFATDAPSYYIAIPELPSITSSGWNSFNSDSIGYYLATSGTDKEATTMFTFGAASIDEGVKQNFGAIVEDYSTKKVGTYQDTITFTVSMDAAAATTLTLTITDTSTSTTSTFNYQEGWTWQNMIDTYPDTFSKDTDGDVRVSGNALVDKNNQYVK